MNERMEKTASTTSVNRSLANCGFLALLANIVYFFSHSTHGVEFLKGKLFFFEWKVKNPAYGGVKLP